MYTGISEQNVASCFIHIKMKLFYSCCLQVELGSIQKELVIPHQLSRL